MNITKKNNKIIKTISFYFIFFFLFFICSVFWNKIEIGYNNPEEIIGYLSEKKFNPTNNVIRYFLFISIFFVFFFLYYQRVLGNNNKKKIFNFINQKKIIPIKETEILLFFIIVVFIDSYFFNLPINNLDNFHEGEWLTPAYIYNEYNHIWSQSYFAHGFFYDVLHPVISWKLFNNYSIASSRLFILYLIILKKILLLILVYLITNQLKLKKKSRIIFFFLLSITVLYLSKISLETSYLNFRDIIIVLFLISVLLINKSFFNFLTGLLAAISLFISIDRGIYINLIFLFLIFFFTLIKQKKKTSLLLLGFLSGWILFINFFGIQELEFFFLNTLQIIKSKPFIDSYIYPNPIFSKDWPATKGLLIISAVIVLFVKELFINNEDNDEIKLLILVLFLISILTYLNALGRSDQYHIKYSLGFTIILITLLLLKQNLIKLKISISSLKLKTTLIIIFFFMVLLKDFHKKNFKIDRNKITYFANLDNNFFLEKKFAEAMKYYSEVSSNDKCLAYLTNEAVIPFLIKKKPCSKYYITWFAATKNQQNEYIKKLEINRPKYLLFESPMSKDGVDGIKNSIRHPIIFEYIKKKYNYHTNINGWIFYSRI